MKRALVVGILAGLLGCATVKPVSAPEAVGTLAPSYHSIAVAPVHATTDFGSPQVVDTGDDVSSTVTTVSAAPDAGSDADLPEVAPKNDGVTLGGVRE